jgi:hypothetical protein
MHIMYSCFEARDTRDAPPKCDGGDGDHDDEIYR